MRPNFMAIQESANRNTFKSTSPKKIFDLSNKPSNSKNNFI
jgi:hypothetical protein